jgi:hypothetical protein
MQRLAFPWFMLVITTDHKIPFLTLNHSGLCTTCFIICINPILSTDCIYEIHMILRIKVVYDFLKKMFLKETLALNKYISVRAPPKLRKV